MAQPPKEDKKFDFSCLPRGAISIKGLPVSRNTRLPSIRSPRDLTLGAAPKRTFMPNIPVRREKKHQVTEKALPTKQENVKVDRRNNSPQLNDRGRGRGRGKAQIIQTQGSIFSEGIATNPLLRKEKMRDSYQRAEHSSSKGVYVKKEKEENDIAGVSRKMDELFRDDFIDDGDDDEIELAFKPVVFPPTQVKKETKAEVKEPAVNFDPNIAKDMGFDINRVAKFIKKEKGVETSENEEAVVLNETVPNEIRNLLNNDDNSSNLVLIQFPEFINLDQRMDDSESSHKQSTNSDSKISNNNQNASLASIKSLPEGYIGKLQVLKSGKTRLLIGPLEYSLDSINSLESKHEIVSIKSNSNPGDLTVLGHVQQKLKFVPNEDCFLA